MEKATLIEQRILSAVGAFFTVPAVAAFIEFCECDNDDSVARIFGRGPRYHLSDGLSIALFIAILAIAGAYMMKGNLRAWFYGWGVSSNQ